MPQQKTDHRLTVKEAFVRCMLTFLAGRRPLVAVLIITAAQEEVIRTQTLPV